MPEEPKDWSVVRHDVKSRSLKYEDDHREVMAKFLAEQHALIHPGDQAFAIPTAWRKHYFNDLLTSLRLTQSEYTK